MLILIQDSYSKSFEFVIHKINLMEDATKELNTKTYVITVKEDKTLN